MLAATACAAVINDRFHENMNAEVAPHAQFPRDETIGMGTDTRAHRIAFDLPGVTNRTVYAQTELVIQHGHDDNALLAESFTAPYFSACSSSVASSEITWKSAVFDESLITSPSKVSQNRIVDGDIEKFEGGRDYRPQQTRCRVETQRLPLLLHEGGDCRLPLLHALLHGGPREGLSAVPPSSQGGEEKVYSPAIRSLPSSKGGERDTYSSATLLHVDASVYSPADDEFELTALTATSCSHVSAYDSNNAVDAVTRGRDVTVILSSEVLNAALGTTTSIVHGAKGTLSPGSIQTVTSHRHRHRATLTDVFSPDLPYWSRSYHYVFHLLTPTHSSRWSILLCGPYGADDCFVLACDGLSLTLSSSAGGLN